MLSVLVPYSSVIQRAVCNFQKASQHASVLHLWIDPEFKKHIHQKQRKPKTKSWIPGFVIQYSLYLLCIWGSATYNFSLMLEEVMLLNCVWWVEQTVCGIWGKNLANSSPRRLFITQAFTDWNNSNICNCPFLLEQELRRAGLCSCCSQDFMNFY